MISPDIKKHFRESGEEGRPSTPEEFHPVSFAAEIEKTRKTVKLAGIRVE